MKDIMRVYNTRESFTLIELLVVVSIISILAVFVIMTLNPAELLRQGRDSQRVSDLDTINHALGLFQVDNANGSLGTASITYISIPDTTATSTTLGNQCGGLNLPTLPSGWAYHCSASSTYRNTDGTGWLPVNFSSASFGSPLGSLPVDPINNATTSNYYTYNTNGSGWVLKAPTLESVKQQSLAAKDGGLSPTVYEVGSSLFMATPYVFPINWVKVPGNGAYGTSDFYVMKYDAKCVQASTNLPLNAPDTGYHTYADNSQNCSGSYYPASTPDGYPIASVSHTSAVTYCSNMGAHLLTNDEYMTIVRNAEQVASNWTGGSVGSGAIYSGHNDNAPALALAASTDDTQGYARETNTGGNQRRTLTLSNGNVVWDFAGNVWQHVKRSVLNVGDLTTTMALPSCTGGGASWNWCQFSSISGWTSDVAQSISGPSNTGWNSTQGVGQVYTYGTGGNQATTVFIRGGSWGDGAIAGPFALYLNWGTGYTGYNVGFRCAR